MNTLDEKIVKEFDEKFFDTERSIRMEWIGGGDMRATTENIKDFLRSALLQAREDERNLLLNQKANQHDQEVRKLVGKEMTVEILNLAREGIYIPSEMDKSTACDNAVETFRKQVLKVVSHLTDSK
jgi:hypothetical protein